MTGSAVDGMDRFMTKVCLLVEIMSGFLHLISAVWHGALGLDEFVMRAAQ